MNEQPLTGEIHQKAVFGPTREKEQEEQFVRAMLNALETNGRRDAMPPAVCRVSLSVRAGC